MDLRARVPADAWFGGLGQGDAGTRSVQSVSKSVLTEALYFLSFTNYTNYTD